MLAGKGATTGVGLVEVYDLDPAADSRLANIATRGRVGDGLAYEVFAAAGVAQRAEDHLPQVGTEPVGCAGGPSACFATLPVSIENSTPPN